MAFCKEDKKGACDEGSCELRDEKSVCVQGTVFGQMEYQQKF